MTSNGKKKSSSSTSAEAQHKQWLRKQSKAGTLTAEAWREHWNDLVPESNDAQLAFRATFFDAVKELEAVGASIPKSWLREKTDSLLLDAIQTCAHFAPLWAQHCRTQNDPMTQSDWLASGVAKSYCGDTLTFNNVKATTVYAPKYWQNSGTAEDAITLFNAMDSVPDGPGVREPSVIAAGKVIGQMLAEEQPDRHHLNRLMGMMPKRLLETLPNRHQLLATSWQNDLGVAVVHGRAS